MEDRCTEHILSACPMPAAPVDAKTVLHAHPLCSRNSPSIWSHQADQRYRGKCSLVLQIFSCLSQFLVFCSTVLICYQNIPVISMFLYPNCIFHMASSTQKQPKNLAEHVPELELWKMFTLRKETDRQLLFISAEWPLAACRLHGTPCPGHCAAHRHSSRLMESQSREASSTLLSPEAKAPRLPCGRCGRPLLPP